MNKTIRLSTTGIEYGDVAWNFGSGCGNQINGICKSGGFKCWAYSISQRFEDNYPNGFTPTIYQEAFLSPLYLKTPSRILCFFMGDFFWDCPEFDPNKKFHSLMPSGTAFVTMSLKGWIFTTISQCPQHTFLFLTKQPQNLIRWSPFPENAWVGVTATNADMFQTATAYLKDIEASVKYVSIEPLLSWNMGPNAMAGYLEARGISWLNIGAQTKPYKPPQLEWVQEIVEACDKAGVKVFLKDNLLPVLPIGYMFSMPNNKGVLRQEMPNESAPI